MTPSGQPRMLLLLSLLVATALALAGCGDDSSPAEPEDGGEAVNTAPAGTPTGQGDSPPRGVLPEQSDEEMTACLEEAGLTVEEGGGEAVISGPNGDVAVYRTFPSLAAARSFTSQLSVDYVAAGPRVALIQDGASDEDVGALGGCIGL